MAATLTIRRTPQLASNLDGCRKLLCRINGKGAAPTDSDIARDALACYRERLQEMALAIGKLKR